MQVSRIGVPIGASCPAVEIVEPRNLATLEAGNFDSNHLGQNDEGVRFLTFNVFVQSQMRSDWLVFMSISESVLNFFRRTTICRSFAELEKRNVGVRG